MLQDIIQNITGVKNLPQTVWDALTEEQQNIMIKHRPRITGFNYIARSDGGLLYLERLKKESDFPYATAATARVIAIAPNGLISEMPV